MSSRLSPLVSLATSIHAQPGVYAVLLGSGASTGAGLLTGWGVVTELVTRVAATISDEAVTAARTDPEAWWLANGDGPLGYSSLLEQIAPSAAARQGLLAGFFESSDDDESPRRPSRAHHALAEMVRRGSVRVIVTTNFDRLMEQALESVGISPQVISRPEAVNGMAPLAHSRATIIKLHGDYRDLGVRNTPDELSSYPPEWTTLLRQVFDEYGLLISGWSADWDFALADALLSAPARRYPLYWDERSSRGSVARGLLASRGGRTIPASSADDLFRELLESLESLDRLSSPPLTVAMAVARLKRYLPDPVRRIELHDLVMDATDLVVDHIESQLTNAPEGGAVTWAELDVVIESYFGSMELLTQLLIAGVWHDPDGIHDGLWCDVLQRLVSAGASFPPVYVNQLRSARLIPAFIALATLGITAIRRGREELLIKMATQVEGPIRVGNQDQHPAAHVLHYLRILDDDTAKALPRWEGEWMYPASHLFATDIRRFFAEQIPSDEDFLEAFRGFEYRLGLIQESTPGYHAASGEYVLGWEWNGQDEVPVVEASLRRVFEKGRAEPWISFLAGRNASFNDALEAHRQVIARYRRY